MSRVMFINIATYSISILSATFKIFMADDFTLNEKLTSLESVVKSSKIMQGNLEYIPSISLVYPIIKDMVEVANTFPKLNNSVVNNAQSTVVDYLVQDKFGILAHVLLKSKIISDVKEFIEYVD